MLPLMSLTNTTPLPVDGAPSLDLPPLNWPNPIPAVIEVPSHTAAAPPAAVETLEPVPSPSWNSQDSPPTVQASLFGMFDDTTSVLNCSSMSTLMRSPAVG